MTLSVQDLYKAFGDRLVLNGLNLSAERGEAIAIVGPSGSGKSTLLNILGSLETPDKGSVLLGEVQVHLLKGHALEAYRSRSIGFVFQEHLLLPHLTALENVLLPCLGKRDTAPVNRASDLLGRMGLADHVFDLPKTLSGGERQRVALARALIHDPQLILADEPTGSLDQSRAEEQVELLLSEARENGRIVVMVTHNLLLAHRFDRTLSLEQGRLVQEGA